MAGRSSLVATAEQEAELRVLSRSDVRGEADRARAILLTLQGWTSEEVAEAFGVTSEAVRHWRGWFSERGVHALLSSLAPGPSPSKGGQALAVAGLLLRQHDDAAPSGPRATRSAWPRAGRGRTGSGPRQLVTFLSLDYAQPFVHGKAQSGLP
jgi:hypothetical protein